MTAPRLVSEVLDGPKLQLFDGSLGAAEFLGDVPNAALVEEATTNHMALIVGQAIDQLRKHRLPLRFLGHSEGFEFAGRNLRLTGRALPAVRDQVRRDAQQPCGERRPSPLELREARKSLVK